MTDSRLQQYQEALKALTNGDFSREICADPTDELGRLGGAIQALGLSLQQRDRENLRIADLSTGILGGQFLDDVLNHVYESFRSIIPYDRIGCALIDGNQVRARWARSESSKLRIVKGFSAPLEGSSLRAVLAQDKPRILNDLEEYLRDHPASHSTAAIVKEGMRSSLTCPLIAAGRAVGFVFFSSMQRNTYEHAHPTIFQRIAKQLSNAVEKTLQFERMSELNQELSTVNRELQKAHDALRVQATHDGLTRLWNHGAILGLLETMLARARREAQPLTVVMSDIDHFKQINDLYGHPVGDEVIAEVARRLSQAVRGSDFVGRYGGEEFLVLAYPCSMTQAGIVMERIRHSVCELPVQTSRGPLSVTFSVGATISDGSVDLAKVVQQADDALYRAKRAGRNRCELAVQFADNDASSADGSLAASPTGRR